MKKFLSILLVLVISISLSFSAGTKENVEISNSISIIDSYNREVEIPYNPSRIISLGPNITEIISELNINKLIGRTDYCDYPTQVLSLDSIGNLTNPNLEKIIELNPDLVIGSVHCSLEVLENLENLNIPAIAIYDDNNIEGSYNIITRIGKIINEEAKANQIVKNNKELVASIVNRTKDLETKSVYYVVSFGSWGDFTCGGDTYIGKMFDLISADNIAKDIKGWNYSLEQLIEKDPDIIIVSKYYDTKNQFISTYPYSTLKAVKNNNVYEIDNNLLDRQGVRNAQGLLELAKIIYADEFK
ncbi:MAG: ABC transporter substrate-binding protein [Pleomorphochaeta sp.]